MSFPATSAAPPTCELTSVSSTQNPARRCVLSVRHHHLGLGPSLTPCSPPCQLPDGTPGELWISSPSVAQGYWNKPEISEANFRATLQTSFERSYAHYGNGKYLRTGDMAFIEGGRMYYFGRIKDMIIVRGENYYPQVSACPACSMRKEGASSLHLEVFSLWSA